MQLLTFSLLLYVDIFLFKSSNGYAKFFLKNQMKAKFEFLFQEDSRYTGVWKYSGTNEILRRLSKNRLYTKMLRIHLFSIFTINSPQALVALAPLGLLIVKTLTSVLFLLHFFFYAHDVVITGESGCTRK